MLFRRHTGVISVALLLVSCPSPGRQSAKTPTISSPFGLNAPVLVQNASFNWRWVAACFATEDTNRDGVVSVTIGRHGDAYGDDLRSYLLLEKHAPEPIDEYLSASPDGQFIAVAIGGRIWLIDASTSARLDLSSAGADLSLNGNPALPHPAVSFSQDGRAAFVRRNADRTEVVLVELPFKMVSVFQSETTVARVVFLDGTLQVYLNSQGAIDDGIATNLAPRLCRGQPASFTTFGTGAQSPTVVQVALPEARHATAPPEKVLARYHECTLDGSPAIASSVDDRVLLTTALQGSIDADRGPLRWATGAVHRNYCPWKYR